LDDAGSVIRTTTRTTDLPQVVPSGSSSTNWTITDDGGQRYASKLQVVVNYTDVIGSQSATAVVNVPARAGSFSICGTVDDAGAPIEGVQIGLGGTAQSTLTDGVGHYCLHDVPVGEVTLHFAKDGYDSTDRQVTVAGDSVVDASLTRVVSPPSVDRPTIRQFALDADTIVLGGATTLRWNVSNADNVDINYGIGSVPATGSTRVSPMYVTTTYEIVARNSGGTASKTATLTVTDSMVCYVDEVPRGAHAMCNDGTSSESNNRSGTCSSHHGVKCWVCPGPLCNP
jgi:hypothetical protein